MYTQRAIMEFCSICGYFCKDTDLRKSIPCRYTKLTLKHEIPKLPPLVFNKRKVIDGLHGHILAKAKNEKCNRKQRDFLLIVASNYIHLAFLFSACWFKLFKVASILLWKCNKLLEP